MKTKSLNKIVWLFCLVFSSGELWAQTGESGGGLSKIILVGLIVLALALVFTVIVLVSDNLIKIKARQLGLKRGKESFSVIPNTSEIYQAKQPSFANGNPVISLKKGFDIKLEGAVEGTSIDHVISNTVAVQPPNFRGIAPIPKMVVAVGDTVKAGDPIFFDKSNPDIKYCAPVSGEIAAINRGAKRAITEVVILADKENVQYRDYDAFDLEKGSREALVAYLMDSGLWPLLQQRPYNVVADPSVTPRSIFVSTFKSGPLAADQNVVVAGREAEFQKGLDVLAKLTSGQVHLGLDARNNQAPSSAFVNAEGVEKHWFKGPHPSGNVGVQIHHVKPIFNGSDIVWTLGVQDVISLGTLFTTQKIDLSRVIALTGSPLTERGYIRVSAGAQIKSLVSGRMDIDLAQAEEGAVPAVRLISGDVLSGQEKGLDQYMNLHDDQLTLLKEGDYYEPFGWLIPSKLRPSLSRTYPNFLLPSLTFDADTNAHGEHRAFVVTGQYESVLPMDIYVQHLMKAILVNDLDRMEGLGLYELAEEDVALCEFACTSKQPLQRILRKGLDVLREQG